MLRLKLGVRLHGIVSQMILAAVIVDQVYGNQGVTECWITTGIDGVHKVASAHYRGDALDFRIHNVPQEQRGIILDHIRAALGEDYDVLHEYIGTDQEHIHIQWKPKAAYK